MTIYSFKEFIGNLILEALHPELQEIVSSKSNYGKKIKLINKIKNLTDRGEKTGIEGNMPEGSSRAYLQHEEPHQIVLDGKPTTIKVGTKIAVRGRLDPYHFGDSSLGSMQNEAENNDHYVNSNYRIITEGDTKGHYKTNTDKGIFPPLIDHDVQNHEWSHVGHVRDFKSGEFGELTKTEDYPTGISHKDFFHALERYYKSWHGRYKPETTEREKWLDHVQEHPLVQKFVDYHGNFDAPTGDIGQKTNLGVWQHPNGSKFIIARDHGFSHEVASAYHAARQRVIAQDQRSREHY